MHLKSSRVNLGHVKVSHAQSKLALFTFVVSSQQIEFANLWKAEKLVDSQQGLRRSCFLPLSVSFCGRYIRRKHCNHVSSTRRFSLLLQDPRRRRRRLIIWQDLPSQIKSRTMDSRSSSGSGSHSANLNPSLNFNQARPRTLQQATYTTAGTVYNPQTAPPLQPPARRGRASRWPPANPADLSTFNNSVLGVFPRARHRSPPTTASTLRHYSPLQQNQDRAIGPRNPADHHCAATSSCNPQRTTSGDSSNMTHSFSNALPRNLLADEVPKSFVCNECREQFQTIALAEFHVTLSGHDNFSEASDDNNRPDGDAFLQDEENKEEEDLTQFNNYSVKTLTNLASYPNPNQKMAQRCLDRARETFKTAAESTGPVSRSSSQLGFNAAGNSSSSYLGGSGRESSEYYSRVPRNAHTNSSTRSSVLSNGPGAPQPLTAGPPGQRHYKASTLEGPLRALQDSAQNPYSLAAAESLFGTNPPNPSAVSSLGRPPSTQISEASRTAERDMRSSRPLKVAGPPHPVEQTASRTSQGASGAMYRENRYHVPIMPPNQKNIWMNGIRETKTQDDLWAYYRHSHRGLPCDYNPATFGSVPDDNSDLQPPSGRVLPSNLEAQVQRDIDLACHQKRFYAGDSLMLRSWEYTFDEICDKAPGGELGHLNDSGPLNSSQTETAVNPSQLGKPRDISISLINKLQPHEAAHALLPMLFKALTNFEKNSHGVQRPQKHKGRDRRTCPRPGYVGQEREERRRAQSDWAHPQTPSRGENRR